MTQLDELLHTLGVMRVEANAPPAAGFRVRARAAMHAEVERRRSARHWTALLNLLRLRLLAATGAAVAAAVLVLGWSSSSGSPLYSIRLAREQAQLLIPGIDRCAAELGDAEGRLADARAGRNVSASLDAAAALLAAAKADVPAGGSSPDFARWIADEADLASLRAQAAGATSPHGPQPSTSTGLGVAGSGQDGGATDGAVQPSASVEPSGDAMPGDRGDSSSTGSTSGVGSDGGSTSGSSGSSEGSGSTSTSDSGSSDSSGT